MKSGIIYKGPSRIDGAPIVVLATYSNRNTKTGAVVQTYILCEDVNPLEASKTGADASICGTCPLRGTPTTDPQRKQAAGRRCYVNLGQGVLTTWRAYHRGVYPDAQSAEARASIGRGRVVRVGTYGDPAAVPDHVWTELLAEATTWTAYTHQKPWRPDIAMQSADSHSRGASALARRPPHVPRDHRACRARQGKRDALPSVERGRPPRSMRRLPPLQGQRRR
jgi:hypothetical protein